MSELARFQDAFALELRIPREWRRLPLAQIGEDEPQVVADRVAPDLDAGTEGLWLGGLLGALPVPVVLPAVVEAADLLALHPAGAELRPPMRTPECDKVGRAGPLSLWKRAGVRGSR